MSLATWVVAFSLLSAICAWVVFGTGTDQLLRLLARPLRGPNVSGWLVEAVELAVGVLWAVLVFAFILGLAGPELRPVLLSRPSLEDLPALNSPMKALGDRTRRQNQTSYQQHLVDTTTPPFEPLGIHPSP
jgi:hypothetical protein